MQQPLIKLKAEYAKQLMDEGYDWLQIPSREAKWANEYVVFDNRNIKKNFTSLLRNENKTT